MASWVGLFVGDSSSLLESGAVGLCGVGEEDSSCVGLSFEGDDMEEDSLDWEGEWEAVRFRGIMVVEGASSRLEMSGICGGFVVLLMGLMMGGGLTERGICGSSGLVVDVLLLDVIVLFVVWLLGKLFFMMFVVVFDCVGCCLKPIAVAYWAMVASRLRTMDCSIVGDGCKEGGCLVARGKNSFV